MDTLCRFLKIQQFARCGGHVKCALGVGFQCYRDPRSWTKRYSSVYNRPVSEIISKFQERFLISQDVWPSPTNWTWDRVQSVLSDAEKVVGYPAPLFGLKCLLSSEMGTIAGLIHRLVGSNHPLLETARFILNSRRYTPQTQGLIVLLLSKAAGSVKNASSSSTDTGPLPKQRSLAEVVEMIHTVYLIHGGLLNLKIGSDVSENQDLQLGNRIATLIGDYLLATACNVLASLRKPMVVEAISKAITSFSESEFIRQKNDQGLPTPYPGISVSDWEEWTFAGSGTLLAHSCQSALLLADHDEALQKKAYDFGKYVAFAWQACAELQIFTDPSYQPSHKTFDLTSLPVILHIANDNDVLHYIESHANHLESLDFQKLHGIISNGDGVPKARSILNDYVENAIQLLGHFESSDATRALVNLIGVLR